MGREASVSSLKYQCFKSRLWVALCVMSSGQPVSVSCAVTTSVFAPLFRSKPSSQESVHESLAWSVRHSPSRVAAGLSGGFRLARYGLFGLRGDARGTSHRVSGFGWASRGCARLPRSRLLILISTCVRLQLSRLAGLGVGWSVVRRSQSPRLGSEPGASVCCCGWRGCPQRRHTRWAG